MQRSPLVSVADLAAAIEADGPVLLDVRWSLAGPPGIESYRAGHLPGAVFADLDRDLAGPPGRGRASPAAGPRRRPRPRSAGSGCAPGSPVVVYDDGDASVAARAWWLLRWAGHDDVRVLDGGYAAWLAAGLPVVIGDSLAVTPGDVVVRPGGMPVADADEAAAIARDGCAARRPRTGALPRGERADRPRRWSRARRPQRAAGRQPRSRRSIPRP